MNELANQQGDDGALRELALFAGAGGGILGGHLLGWRTVCAVEWGEYPASVLCARQNEGILPPFPIWSDVQTFDGKPWQGIIDVVSGGFPCQDISAAGKGAGITGERSGMWKHMARIIGEVRPGFVFVENSPMLTSRGIDVVLGDLAEMGFDAEWGVISAADCGAQHLRKRIWIVAYPKLRRIQERWGTVNPFENVPDRATIFGHERKSDSKKEKQILEHFFTKERLQIEPELVRKSNVVAARVDRLKAIGNGQVPIVAATAWNILSK